MCVCVCVCVCVKNELLACYEVFMSTSEVPLHLFFMNVWDCLASSSE